MNKKEIIKEVADIHNIIAAISVRGDEAIAMAQALVRMRNLVGALSKDKEETEGIETKGG